MKRYIAFLRGINISGKNKIPMKQLTVYFGELGFADVKTYLNSGNVAFSSDMPNEQNLANQIEQIITEKFGFFISVYVISAEELEDILQHAPEWWGTEDKEVYDNLIFILKPATFREVYDGIGEPKAGLEQILAYKDIVFWSFLRKDYQKTNWWSKTANKDMGDKLTIRTAGTVRKICEM